MLPKQLRKAIHESLPVPLQRVKAKAGRLARYSAGRFATVSQSPILVLGNQKAGTTVIAAALAHCADVSVTLDIRDLSIDLLSSLYDGTLSPARFVNRYRRSFSRKVIKEPGLTFAYERLTRYFPDASVVIVVRDPRDNVRSILDRLGLPGDAPSLPPGALTNVNAIWRHVVKDGVPGVEADHYVEALAHRWNRTAMVYLRHSDGVHLVRYEDFCTSKATHIRTLARRLNLAVKQPVDSVVETQYQSQGNRDLSWEAFFGPENVVRIEKICAATRSAFGYHRT